MQNTMSFGPFKVLQICTSRSWGGMEMHMPILCEKLRERGHTVLPVCYQDSPLDEELRRRAFEPVRLNLRGYVHPIGLWRLGRLIRRFGPDVIHAHYSRDLWTIVPAMKLSHPVPLVLIKHIGTRRPKRDPLHRWLYSSVSHAIAISRVIHQNLERTHPLPAEKIGVIHHGIDLKQFRFREEDRRAVRAELGIRPEEKVIGIIGRLQIGKGYLEFLQMARRVKTARPDVRFLIVGEATHGETKEADVILRKIREWDLEDWVIRTGFRRDIPRVLSAMDLFVFPSHAEAFGLVLIEAMAVGLPIVSSNCDGVLDIVQHGETGWLVPPKDVTQLTEAVLALLDDEQKRKAFGEAARRRTESHFDIEWMVDRVEDVYERLVRQVRIRKLIEQRGTQQEDLSLLA